MAFTKMFAECMRTKILMQFLSQGDPTNPDSPERTESELILVVVNNVVFPLFIVPVLMTNILLRISCSLCSCWDSSISLFHVSSQKNCTTQNECKKLKPGSVASYDIWPGNGEDLFLFRHFTNLSEMTYFVLSGT